MSKNQVKRNQDNNSKCIRKAFGPPKSREKVITEIRKTPDTYNLFKSFTDEDQEKIIQFLTGEKTLQILSDKFFQKVMNPENHPDRVESLISAIYGQKVKILKVLPREGTLLVEEGSQVIMDILVVLEDDSRVNIEMQRLGYLFPGERSSCYIADMLMRQYNEVHGIKGSNFKYSDMKPVNLIVIMEKSTKEFQKVSPEYIHKRTINYSSGAEVVTLENITYISLDTFKEKADNKIRGNLDAWLTFFTAETSEEVLGLVNMYPEFLPMYQDIAEFRKKPGEVIGMFSEALRIMDRNTTKYMIDEMHQQYEEAVQQYEEAVQQYEEAVQQREEAVQQREEAVKQNENLKKQVAEKDQALKNESRRVDEAKAELAKYKAKYGEI